MNRKTIVLLVLFMLVTWGGAAGIAYGVAQTSEGPRGEQGPQGPQGERGPKGATGAQGSSASTGLSPALWRLAELWALDAVIENFNRAGMTSTGDPQVEACTKYILSGVGSSTECGYQRAE